MNINEKVSWTIGRHQNEIDLIIYDQNDKMIAIIPMKEILKLYKEFK